MTTNPEIVRQTVSWMDEILREVYDLCGEAESSGDTESLEYIKEKSSLAWLGARSTLAVVNGTDDNPID